MSQYNNPYNKNPYNTYYNEDDNKYYVKEDDKAISWFVIFIVFCIVPPIGVFMAAINIFKGFAGQADKKRHKKKKKFSQRKLLQCGSTVLAVLAVMMLFLAMRSLILMGLSTAGIWLLVQSGCYLVGSFIATGMVKNINKKEKQRLKYAAIVGNKPYISIAEIAGIMDISEQSCAKELGQLLENGLFGSLAYLDKGQGLLVINAAMLPAIEPVNAKTVNEAETGFNVILQEIRQVNEDIKDERISERIDVIEQLTAQIFAVVDKDATKLPQIKTFLNYYLPTTLKLLHSYAQLESQWEAGVNINTAKKDIEKIMDTLVECYRQQLDRLFADEKMDITSDIQVLENMMARDGIGNNLRTMGQR